ncbi:MAG TPA: hypothetical protein VNI77_05110, partial [Nitrososphaera sp.]|nr:hypothetical protein [Nitrososphaera sp.]
MAKKVVITHTYSLNNRGDYLLLKGTIAILRQILGNDTYFQIFSSNPREDSEILGEDSCIEFIDQIPYPVYNVRNLRRLIVSITTGLVEYISLSIHIQSKQSIPLFLVPATHKKTIQSLIDSDYIIARSIDQISDI